MKFEFNNLTFQIILYINLIFVIYFIFSYAVLTRTTFFDKESQSIPPFSTFSFYHSFISFLASLYLLFVVIASNKGAQLDYITGVNFDICYIDNLSAFMVVLTTSISSLCYFWLTDSVEYKIDLILCVKLIEFCMINAFTTADLLYFYIFFEFSAIPLLFIIGRNGPSFRKIKAVQYFFGYTLFGSAFLLSGIILIYSLFGSTNFFYIQANITSLTFFQKTILWFSFFFAFAVKIPTVPFHLWLLEAHVEAPTVGSVILAAILLKIGGYGLIRFCIQLFSDASSYYYPVAFIFGLGSLLFSTFNALAQIDLKRIIAYSSIAHMNGTIVSLFALNSIAFKGAILSMLSHGVTSAGLFFLAGVLYKIYHSKNIVNYGGLNTLMPKFSFFFIFFVISNISFPGTFNFVAELLLLIGTHETSAFVAWLFLFKTGILFVFFMSLINRICFTEIDENSIKCFFDLSTIETIIFAILGILTLVFGIYPNFILINI